jgi:hypothetical protein
MNTMTVLKQLHQDIDLLPAAYIGGVSDFIHFLKGKKPVSDAGTPVPQTAREWRNKRLEELAGHWTQEEADDFDRFIEETFEQIALQN